MRIGKLFRELTYKQYLSILENHKKYTDFNILGLYRSLLENERLTADQKEAILEATFPDFKKTFEFLQVKDPYTYIGLVTLRKGELTRHERQLEWDKIYKYQTAVLKKKRIRHRNFGVYGRHMCCYIDCPMDGIMTKQDTGVSEDIMILNHDSKRRKKTHFNKRPRMNRRERKHKNYYIDEYDL